MSISLEVFKDADSAKLFSGQLVSQICDKMMTLGLVWVISLEQSNKLVPWFLAAGALPHLLMSFHAGGWASKLGPLRTAIWTDFARGILFLAAGAFWPSIPVSAQVATIFLLTLGSGIASALFNPAILSLPPLVVREELAPRLTAMMDSCFSMSAVVGPLIAAILYPFIGLRGLFVLNAVSYLIAAAAEASIRTPVSAQGAAPEAPPLSAFSLLRQDRLIFFMLTMFFLMNLVLTPMIAFLPIFVQSIFHGQFGTLAGLETSIGIGTIAGGLFLSVAHFQMSTGKRAILGMILTSLMYLVFSLNHIPLIAFACLAILGLSLAIANISLITFFQTRRPPQDVPVVMGLVNLISVGALPFSMLLSGVLLDFFEPQKLAAALALIALAITAITSTNREFRSL